MNMQEEYLEQLKYDVKRGLLPASFLLSLDAQGLLNATTTDEALSMLGGAA